jgi:hypothetical protein
MIRRMENLPGLWRPARTIIRVYGGLFKSTSRRAEFQFIDQARAPEPGSG